MLAVISLLCLGVAAIGAALTVIEIVAVRAFARARPRGVDEDGLEAASIGVTILKPLHGDEPGLLDNLASFARQDHRGPVQLLFGVADADDPALARVQALRAAFPALAIDVVISERAPGGNAKVANLMAMSAAIRHHVVVLSDSDIRVDPDYLRRTVAALQAPGVGLVTCLFRGESAGGPWGRLAAMWIDERFFPSVLLGLRFGRAKPCVGATMAFTRSTLARIGGFAAFADRLADDYAIGEAVRKSGQAVVVARHVVEHRCHEQSLAALWQHELRWARTIRGLDGGGHASSFVLHPLPFILGFAALRGFDAAGWAALLVVLTLRALLQWQAGRALGRAGGLSLARLLIGPARDILSFAVFCASFLTDAVAWRGRRYRVARDGTMIELKG